MMQMYTRIDSERDGYPAFEDAIKKRFEVFANEPLFTTNAEGLFDAFLAGLPEYARQHYNCNCCKNFVTRYGGLVTITEYGNIVSVLWDENEVPVFFAESVRAMKELVLKSRVNGIFVSKNRVLGTPEAGGWSHMSATLPADKVFRSALKNAEQVMAEKREDFRILMNGLLEYPADVVDKAVVLLESDTLYRADRVLGVAKFLQELHAKRSEAKDSRHRDNITWLALAKAPAGFAHVKSSMISTLLDDIKAGYSTHEIKRRFEEKMNPANYMRAQSAPSMGNIQQAEKIVAQLGIAESLRRRYAKFEEIPQFIWTAKESEKKQSANVGGVFGHIVPKEKQNVTSNEMNLPTTVMTWAKFQRTVLPNAESIEVLVDNPSRLMALVTAANPEAPNILQWDNTFSWYYHGGIDGEIKRRVIEAGGRYEDNEIRCSLIWDGYTDLDLHCIAPGGSHICYHDKRADGRGWLDVDANGIDGKTPTPVENMRWAQGLAREGAYKFYVHNFHQHGSYGTTPFKVELEVNGQIYTFSGSLAHGQQVKVFEFNYVKGQYISIAGSEHQSVENWFVPVNSFVKVKGITESPNLWGDSKAEHIGQHIFFILDGVRDTSEGKGRGFFVETLKSDLREIRRTLEAYATSTPIEGVDEASACGVGYSKDNDWNLTVKVKTNGTTRLIKIDRFD